MTLTEINAAILSGSIDDDMREVELAIKQRKEYIKNRMMMRLLPGDRVRVDNIRPKAICGLVAEVKKVNRTTISISFGSDAGRYAGPCKVPASCCEKVS